MTILSAVIGPPRSDRITGPMALSRHKARASRKSEWSGIRRPWFIFAAPGWSPAADTEALLRALARLKAAGNSLFVVEHELDVVRHADWIVDVGPGAGEQGGEILYSGPLSGLAEVPKSQTRRYLLGGGEEFTKSPRDPADWLKLRGVARNNLDHVDVNIPLGVFTSITGVSGAGKSSLISQFLVEAIADKLGQRIESGDEDDGLDAPVETQGGEIVGGLDRIKRLVVVDQKPIGRTPRSNLATIPVFSIMSASFSRPQSRPASDVTMRVDFHSMSRKDAAKHARAKGSCAWSFCFSRASMLPVRPARAHATTPRPSR